VGIPDPPHFFKQQLSQLGIGLGVGAVFVLSAELGTIGRIVGGTDLLAESPALQLLWRLFVNTTPLMLGIGLLAYIYKYVTDVKVPWRTVLPGAVLAGAMFEAAKVGFVLYLDNFANFDQVYGGVSTVVVLLLWFYVVSVILVFGAEVASEYGRSRESGRLVFGGQWRPVRGGLALVTHLQRQATPQE
jgi:membrane protein